MWKELRFGYCRDLSMMALIAFATTGVTYTTGTSEELKIIRAIGLKHEPQASWATSVSCVRGCSSLYLSEAFIQ